MAIVIPINGRNVDKQEDRTEREVEVLREEYKRAIDNPLYDDPMDYLILADLILDRIEVLDPVGHFRENIVEKRILEDINEQ